MTSSERADRTMKLLAFLLTALLALAAPAFAQRYPLTVDLSNGQFQSLPANTPLQLRAPTTGNPSIILPHGTAPTGGALVNGACWTTTAGLYCYINGVTVGPYGAGVGTVTSVGSGTGLTGGPITGSGTLSLASIANHNLLANTSGGSAAPVATTLSALIDDAIGSTQGDILYRGASAWSVLAPGSSGQVLQSGGASANPSWVTAGGGGGGAGNVSTSGSITTDGMVYWAGATSIASTAAPTNGQLLVGSTSNPPALATLTAGSGITVTNGAGSITIATTGTGSGQLLNIQTFTSGSSATYTPTAGTNSVLIELQGGGAGGAAVAAPGSSHVDLGGGGSAGAYCRVYLTSGFSGGTYTVGTKGTGGASGADNGGNNGNNTTFQKSGGGTTYTAAGGTGGFSTGAQTSSTVVGGQSGGTCTNGDLQVAGGYSIWGMSIGLSQGNAGGGGMSHFGAGGMGAEFFTSNAGANGNSCSGSKGAGGGGANSNGTGGTKAGGDGCDGVIIIWEFSYLLRGEPANDNLPVLEAVA